MPSPGSVNITTELYERPYAAYHEQTPPPAWFRPTPPDYSGPTLIVYPGTLNMLERAEVDAWLGAIECQRPAILARCIHRSAIAKIIEYIAYYADATYLAWADACESSRIALWRLHIADALLANKSTVAVSQDIFGTGSGAATVPYPQGVNLT